MGNNFLQFPEEDWNSSTVDLAKAPGWNPIELLPVIVDNVDGPMVWLITLLCSYGSNHFSESASLSHINPEVETIPKTKWVWYLLSTLHFFHGWPVKQMLFMCIRSLGLIYFKTTNGRSCCIFSLLHKCARASLSRLGCSCHCIQMFLEPDPQQPQPASGESQVRPFEIHKSSQRGLFY